MKLILNFFFRSRLFDNTHNFIIKKILKFSKYFFVETDKKTLPEINHPVTKSDLNNFSIYYHKKKFINSPPFISYSHLIDVLSIYYSFKKKISFFDYGAGKLELYFYLSKKFKNLKYYYYDQDIYLKEIKKIKNQFKLKNLIIYKKNSNIKNIDFVYFGSVIQYLINYKKEISFFFNKSNYILITQTPFFTNNSRKEIIVKQLNLHPLINYLYFINLNFFIKFMKKNNYILVSKSHNKVIKFLNFKNINKNYKNIHMYDLLFKYEKQK